MTVKSQIAKKLEDAYSPPDVTAGQVYKGYDYDGAQAASGWWFKPFNAQPTYLGRSGKDALEMIDQIVDGRDE